MVGPVIADVRGLMKYNVKIESEPIGNKESLYLSITHNGSIWTSIRIVNPDVEIPQIIDVLQHYLTSVMRLDGEKQGSANQSPPTIGLKNSGQETLSAYELPCYGCGSTAGICNCSNR